MAQVFLYREGAKITPADLSALRDAGFIPVKVAKFDDVRVIDPFVAGNRPAVWQAAVEAIARANDKEGPKTLFGRLLAEKLAETSLPNT
jgi:hypothetical protein